MAFVTPIFLGALALLSVPIILHLMHRQIPRRIVFPTIRFILKGREPHQGRRGLREILTLLARLGLLAAAIFLFAEPYLRQKAAGGGKAADGHLVVLIDASASMHAAQFETFVPGAVKDILKQHPEAAVTLLVSSSHLETQLHSDTTRDLLMQTVKQLRPGILPGDHQDAIAAAEAALRPGAKESNKVYIISDLQATDWASADLRSLGAQAEIEVVRPAIAARPNAGVLSVQVNSRVVNAKRHLDAIVRVRNFGLAPIERQLVLTAGSRTASRTIRLGAEASDSFVLSLSGPESQIAQVRLEPKDAYTLDDSYHVWIGPKPPMRTAIVSETEGRKGVEAYFLLQALTARQSGFDAFSVKVLAPDFMLTDNASDYQCLFMLDSLKDLSDIEMKSLGKWVENGGCLIYFGGRYAADSLALLARQKLTSAKFLGFQGDLDQLKAFSLGSLTPGNAETAVFEKEPSDLFSFPIYKYCRLRLPTQQKPLLTMATGDPFLSRDDHGSGAVYIVAVNLSPVWSDFPTCMSFVPLLRRIVDQRAGSDFGIVNLELGLEDLSGEGRAPAKKPTDPGVAIISGRPTQMNYTRKESNLEALDDVQFAAQIVSTETSRRRSPGARAAAVGGGRFFNKQLAWVILVLLFAELLLANVEFRPRKRAA